MSGPPDNDAGTINQTRILLHTCCAPCSGGIIVTLLAERITPTLYFYNPSIHPHSEYTKRKTVLMEFAERRGVPFVDGDYDHNAWLTKVAGHEADRERGPRCSICFEDRLVETARYAAAHGFRQFSTTLAISPWKNYEQIRAAGRAAESRWSDVAFVARNWRKRGGCDLMHRTSRQECFYRQRYCGCEYSRGGGKSEDNA